MRIHYIFCFYLTLLLLMPGKHSGSNQFSIELSFQSRLNGILDAPVITKHPESAVKCEGSSVQMRVEATGQNLQYQWQKDGTDIQGATQNLLTLISLKLSHAGNYVCRVSNMDGTVYSNPATLQVIQNLFITFQPQSITLQNGQTAQFTLETNVNPDTYQWYKGNTAIFDGGNVSGSQSSALTISNVGQNDQGKYFCKVNSSCNQVFSDDAYLSIISSNDETDSGMQVWFPNPAINIIQLKEASDKILSVIIYNSQGNEVYLQKDPCINSLDISFLNPGFYKVITITAKTKSAQKLMVLR
jgi:hypothetical protein